MKDSPQSKPVFVKTNVPSLYRHGSGKYYARLTIAGKRQYRSLKTDVKSVALNRLLRELRANNGKTSTPSVPRQHGAPTTFRECLNEAKSRVENNTRLAQPTKVFYELGFKDVEQLWPLMDQQPNVATVNHVLAFLNLRLETRFKPKGAKNVVFADRDKASATTHNRALRGLRAMFNIALEFDLVTKSVAHHEMIKQMTPTPKSVQLPSRENYRKMLTQLRRSPQPKHQEAANLIEFMASTGGRLGGVNRLTWKNIHDGCVFFYEGETEVCKVPLTPDAKALIDAMREKQENPKPNNPLFAIKECQKSIDTACKEVGIPRMTHHDFRHLFATRCIESGVDIPTVSGWLGHKDGGALCMKVYGHLLDHHSREMAQKVRL